MTMSIWSDLLIQRNNAQISLPSHLMGRMEWKAVLTTPPEGNAEYHAASLLAHVQEHYS